MENKRSRALSNHTYTKKNKELWKARRFLIKLFLVSRCMICGKSKFAKMHFHHTSSEKNMEVSNIIGDLSKCPTIHNINNLVTELGLTICVCNSCHQKLHQHTAVLPSDWNLIKPRYSVSRLLEQIRNCGIDFGKLSGPF